MIRFDPFNPTDQPLIEMLCALPMLACIAWAILIACTRKALEPDRWNRIPVRRPLSRPHAAPRRTPQPQPMVVAPRPAGSVTRVILEVS